MDLNERIAARRKELAADDQERRQAAAASAAATVAATHERDNAVAHERLAALGIGLAKDRALSNGAETVDAKVAVMLTTLARERLAGVDWIWVALPVLIGLPSVIYGWTFVVVCFAVAAQVWAGRVSAHRDEILREGRGDPPVKGGIGAGLAWVTAVLSGWSLLFPWFVIERTSSLDGRSYGETLNPVPEMYWLCLLLMFVWAYSMFLVIRNRPLTRWWAVGAPAFSALLLSGHWWLSHRLNCAEYLGECLDDHVGLLAYCIATIVFTLGLAIYHRSHRGPG